MKQLILSIHLFLRKLGYDVAPFNSYQGKPNPERPWESDPEFLALHSQVVQYTLLDRRRLYMLYSLALLASCLDGEGAEIGVYRGGSALLFSHLKPVNRQLYLFDTFRGMPETDPKLDIHRAGDFQDTSLPQVQSLLGKFTNVVFRPGFFPETAAGLENQAFSLVHVDADIYTSVLDCCKFFYPRLVGGGVLVFDDYGFLSCPGAKQAVREFCNAQNTREIYLPTGQALLWKKN